jgi:hypothetical protein
MSAQRVQAGSLQSSMSAFSSLLLHDASFCRNDQFSQET